MGVDLPRVPRGGARSGAPASATWPGGAAAPRRGRDGRDAALFDLERADAAGPGAELRVATGHE